MRNLLVAQSGGPTSAINATIAGVIMEAHASDQVDTIYGAVNGIKGVLEERFVNLSEKVPGEEELEILCQTPAAALGSCRVKLKNPAENDSQFQEIIRIFRKHEIMYFIYAGGNDSMDTVDKLAAYCKEHKIEDIHVMGAPKTIDNDLVGTDHCPGFGSAAKYIATTFSELERDCHVYDTKAVTIVEVMGRNAGWLTGATALAKTEECEGPDLIYLPEAPFDIDAFLSKIKELLKEKKSIVVAVSEGIKLPDGRYVCELSGGGDYVDAFGHRQLTGTAAYLANFLGAEIGCKTRSVEFSTLQRSASHMASRVDINEAFMVGGAAVKAADEGDSGKMVVIDRVSDDPYMSAAGIYDVHKIANNEKTVPRSWMNETADYVTEEFINYIEPLIQGDYPPFMVNGLPQHLVLKK